MTSEKPHVTSTTSALDPSLLDERAAEVSKLPSPKLRRPEQALDVPIEELEDGQLMMRVKAGDHDAFAVLVDRYKDSLTNYMTKLTRNRDRAEEYAQESFVRLYRAADRYRETGQLAGYLFRIATNLLRSDERRNKRWRTLSTVFAVTQEQTAGPSPQRQLLSGEATDVVTQAIAQLPVRYRAALVLREIEGWSYRQIADALECREGTVKSRISRAKQRLRKALEPYWEKHGFGDGGEEDLAAEPGLDGDRE